MVGCHTACTKERFLIALDHSTARHAALSDDTALPDGVTAWTWLPLTHHQAAAFGLQSVLDDPVFAAQNLNAAGADEADDSHPLRCVIAASS